MLHSRTARGIHEGHRGDSGKECPARPLEYQKTNSTLLNKVLLSPQRFLSADILLRRTPAAHGRRGPARLTINVPEPLVSSNSAQPRRPLSARARRGGAFTADDLPGLAGMATRIRRHGPLAPVSRRGREDLWPFSAASGATCASDFDLLASLLEKSRSTTTSALPALPHIDDHWA